MRVGRCFVWLELRRTKFVKILGWVSVRLNGGLPEEPQSLTNLPQISPLQRIYCEVNRYHMECNSLTTGQNN